MHQQEIIGELSSILGSVSLRIVLDERKEYLQKEVNRFVRAKDITEAYGALCKLEDLDKLVEIMYKKLEDLKKGT